METTTRTCAECGDTFDHDPEIADYAEICEDCESACEPLTDSSVEAQLVTLLDGIALIHPDDLSDLEVPSWLTDASVQTYESAGALTYDKGVWITLQDGTRVTLTIKVQ